MDRFISLGGWQQQVPVFSKTCILVGHYHNSLTVVATIIVLKDSISGEHILVFFGHNDAVIIATVWPTKHP